MTYEFPRNLAADLPIAGDDDLPPARPDWWRTDFDDLYAAVIEQMRPDSQVQAEADVIADTLRRHGINGGRLLDAPCGSGRHARSLAQAGYRVHGIDCSDAMIDLARARAELAGDPVHERISFARHELQRLSMLHVFDAAYNVFTSLGYTTHPEDDLATLRVLHRAVRPNGLLLVETDHLAAVQQHFLPHYRFELNNAELEGRRTFTDGVFHEQQWVSWQGARSTRVARLRIYSTQELLELCSRAGFIVEETLAGDASGPVTDESRLLIVARAGP